MLCLEAKNGAQNGGRKDECCKQRSPEYKGSAMLLTVS